MLLQIANEEEDEWLIALAQLLSQVSEEKIPIDLDLEPFKTTIKKISLQLDKIDPIKFYPLEYMYLNTKILPSPIHNTLSTHTHFTLKKPCSELPVFKKSSIQSSLSASKSTSNDFIEEPLHQPQPKRTIKEVPIEASPTLDPKKEKKEKAKQDKKEKKEKEKEEKEREKQEKEREKLEKKEQKKKQKDDKKEKTKRKKDKEEDKEVETSTAKKPPKSRKSSKKSETDTPTSKELTNGSKECDAKSKLSRRPTSSRGSQWTLFTYERSGAKWITTFGTPIHVTEKL
eukprot:gene1209-1398_t